MAIQEALKAAHYGEAPVAAVIIQHDKLLSIGHNAMTSEESSFDHAEINALIAAKPLLGRRPKECTLYSTLEPCAMCLGAITFFGIRNVVFGAADPFGGASARFAQHETYRSWMPELIAGVLQEECEALKALPTFNGEDTTFMFGGSRGSCNH